MPDKPVFDPEKITLIDFKIIHAHIDAPEHFNSNKIEGHQLENELQLGFSLGDKLAKADFTVSLKTDSKGENSVEASGRFHFVFIYRVSNLEELAGFEKNNRLKLQPALVNALSSVTYSTSRGVLITKLQGTALQNFMLPIVNPSKLLVSK